MRTVTLFSLPPGSLGPPAAWGAGHDPVDWQAGHLRPSLCSTRPTSHPITSSHFVRPFKDPGCPSSTTALYNARVCPGALPAPAYLMDLAHPFCPPSPPNIMGSLRAALCLVHI